MLHKQSASMPLSPPIGKALRNWPIKVMKPGGSAIVEDEP